LLKDSKVWKWLEDGNNLEMVEDVWFTSTDSRSFLDFAKDIYVDVVDYGSYTLESISGEKL